MEIYTVYFDSGMPFYSDKVLNGSSEGSTLELKLPIEGLSSSARREVVTERTVCGTSTSTFHIATARCLPCPDRLW